MSCQVETAPADSVDLPAGSRTPRISPRSGPTGLRMHASRPAFVVLSLLMSGCLHTASEARRDELPLLLHAVHSSGGDAPLMTGVAVFEDGLLRYVEGGRRPMWARLSGPELTKLRAEVRSEEFAAAVEALPRGPECCDVEWIAVERERSAGTVDAVKGAPTVSLPVSSVAPAIREVLSTLSTVCRRHLGRPFPVSGPEWPVARFPSSRFILWLGESA